MRTITELINQPPFFAGIFTDQDLVLDAFGLTRADSKGTTILYAWYDRIGNKGNAFILCEKAGVLYEVWVDHGKYYGISGQWDPEDCDLDRVLDEAEKAEKAKKKKWNKNKPPKLPGLYFFLTGEEYSDE